MKRKIRKSKETQPDKGGMAALNDDELELAVGGSDGGAQLFVCDKCGFYAGPFKNTDEKKWVILYHRNLGCTGAMRYKGLDRPGSGGTE